jgi:hypothetical protein
MRKKESSTAGQVGFELNHLPASGKEQFTGKGMYDPESGEWLRK